MNSICVAHWSVQQEPDSEPIDRDDPYYFEQCYEAYVSLNIEPSVEAA